MTLFLIGFFSYPIFYKVAHAILTAIAKRVSPERELDKVIAKIKSGHYRNH